jgi:hypothetical protein
MVSELPTLRDLTAMSGIIGMNPRFFQRLLRISLREVSQCSLACRRGSCARKPRAQRGPPNHVPVQVACIALTRIARALSKALQLTKSIAGGSQKRRGRDAPPPVWCAFWLRAKPAGVTVRLLQSLDHKFYEKPAFLHSRLQFASFAQVHWRRCACYGRIGEAVGGRVSLC